MLSFLPVQRALFSGVAIMGAPTAGPTVWGDKTASVVLSNGNLTATEPGSAYGRVRATNVRNAGQLHFELTIVGADISETQLGFSEVSPAGFSSSNAHKQLPSGSIFNPSDTLLGFGDPYASGNTIAFEINFGTNQFWIQKFGSPRRGPCTLTPSDNGFAPWAFFFDGSVTLNVGGSAFAITPTSGFSAWG